MLITGGYRGDLNKIEAYLKEYGVDHSCLIIVVNEGKWFNLNIFGKIKDYIRIYARCPKWVPWFLRDYINSKIILHEYGHIKGIVKCENSKLKRIFCLMYEGDNWFKELLMSTLQFLGGLRFCKRCKQIVEK